MKKLLLLFIVTGLLISCSTDDEEKIKDVELVTITNHSWEKSLEEGHHIVIEGETYWRVLVHFTATNNTDSEIKGSVEFKATEPNEAPELSLSTYDFHLSAKESKRINQVTSGIVLTQEEIDKGYLTVKFHPN